jgi:histidine ammonia-lyase
MPVTITGKNLTIEDIYNVAVRGEKVQLDTDALARIKKCRIFLEKRIEAKETMYGVNTGIGELVNVVLTEDQIKEF